MKFFLLFVLSFITIFSQNFGEELSSGIYFLQLKQETGISTIKLLLEK